MPAAKVDVAEPMTAKFVVVALVVVAVSAVRLKIVDDAFEINPWSVGLMEKTAMPVPVSSPSTPASSEEVSMLVVESLLLKSVQSVEER